MHKLRRAFLALDGLVYAIERVVLLVSVVAMIGLVFASVMQRSFSRPVGKTAQVLLTLLGDVPAETEAKVAETYGPVTFWLLAAGLMVAGAQSARSFARRRRDGADARPPPFLASVPIGLGLTLATFLGVKVLLAVFPSGIPGAQPIALGFLVWSGFVGASLAVRARRHIVLDAVKKKLSPDVAPWYSIAGAILTSGFCLFLALMALEKLVVEIGDWSASDGLIGVFEAIPIPVWTITLALPVTLGVMAARFLFAGIGELVFGVSLHSGADEHGIDFEQLAGAGGPKAPTASAGGFVIGRLHGGGGEAARASGAPGGGS